MTDTSTYAPAIPGGRPAMAGDWAELVDSWLTPNGLEGWIPDGSTIVVEGDRITAPLWRHRNADSAPWNGDDLMIAADLWGPGVEGDDGDRPLVDERIVALQVPVTDRIRELFDRSTLTLVER